MLALGRLAAENVDASMKARIHHQILVLLYDPSDHVKARAVFALGWSGEPVAAAATRRCARQQQGPRSLLRGPTQPTLRLEATDPWE